MIQIVTGKLGAGKTLYCVCDMFDDLCNGLTIATNVQINWTEMCNLARKEKRLILEDDQYIPLNPEQNKNWHELIPFGVSGAPLKVYLDEIHLFFNARDFQETHKNNRSLLSFLTQSRKAGVDVTFIAQELTTIEKQFRVLAEWELYVQSSDHIKFGPLGHSPVRFFQVIKRDPVQGSVQGRSCRTYSKRHFKLYESFSFLDEEMNNLNDTKDKIQPKKLKKIPLTTHWLSAFRRPFISLTKFAFYRLKRLYS